MAYSSIVNALPFWILGVPLALAVISYVRMPRQSDLVPPDRREERSNFAREPEFRAGEAVASEG